VAAKARKLKTITLTIGGTSVEAQVTTWNITNNTDDPEIIYTFSARSPTRRIRRGHST
jgi:hypothetical protein